MPDNEEKSKRPNVTKEERTLYAHEKAALAPKNNPQTGLDGSTAPATSTQGESEEMICFLKFYNYLNVKDKKAWKDDLKKNMSDVLLSVGCAGIKHIIECLNRLFEK